MFWMGESGSLSFPALQFLESVQNCQRCLSRAGVKNSALVVDYSCASIDRDTKSEPEKNLDEPFVLGYVLVDDAIHSKSKDRD
jgi:hypothetical protein